MNDFWFQMDTELFKKLQNPVSWSIINVSGFPVQKFPASAWTSEINTHSFIAGAYDAKVWNKTYWTVDKMHKDYKNHIISNSAYYVSLPHYYFGLLNILN